MVMRGLLKHPGFTLIAVVTLALALREHGDLHGCECGVVGPLPFVRAAATGLHLANASIRKASRIDQLPSSYLDFLDWQEQGNLFEGMSMLDGWGGNLTGGEAPEHIDGARVSVNCCPCCALVRRLAGTSRPKKRSPAMIT